MNSFTPPSPSSPTSTSATTDLIANLLVDKFQVDTAAIGTDTPMTELLTDSLMVVEMAITLKDELGISATEDELRQLAFGEFVARIDQRRIG